jgi:HEAT repeat protein
LALGYHPDSEAYTVLIQLLSSPDWRYRRAALEAIAHHTLANTNLEQIIQRLHDPSVYVVRTACEIACDDGAKETGTHLLALSGARRRTELKNNPQTGNLVVQLFLSIISSSGRKIHWTHSC